MPALAQPSDEVTARARERFKQGVEDYDEGRYERALENFQEAYRLKPHPMVRVNMANCYDRLGKPLQAIFHFERYLEANVGSQEQQQEVAEALGRLQSEIGRVRMQVAPDGATVIVDGGERRSAPVMDAVPLVAGHHTVRVELAGYESAERSFDIKGGENKEITITLERAEARAEPVAADASEPTPGGSWVDASDVAPLTEAEAQHVPPPQTTGDQVEPPTDSGGLPTSVWVAGGVSGVFLLTAVVTGGLALSAESDFEEKRESVIMQDTPIDRLNAYNEARDAAARADSLALTTDILLLGALLGAGLTTFLVIKHGKDERQPTTTASLSGAGLRLKTEF